jgi:hypothetical protein
MRMDVYINIFLISIITERKVVIFKLRPLCLRRNRPTSLVLKEGGWILKAGVPDVKKK